MKTVIEMAREAGAKANANEPYRLNRETKTWLERFAELVRADEREACAKVIESHGPFLANGALLVEAIRARGNK